MVDTAPAAPDDPDSPRLRIAMIGTGFMARAHSHAWRTAPRFFDLPLRPELAVIAGRDPARTEAAAAKLGWSGHDRDWRRVIERDDIDLVDIVTPGDTHAEIAVAALEAGKHVLCEKPLANTVADAQRMARAAESAADRGQLSFCGFSYRRTPALTLARRFVQEGRLGAVRHVRAQYLQDWLSDSASPMTWRLDKDRAGSGSLGDIGAHSIDTAQWLTGQRITGVSGVLRTFVSRRPVLDQQVGLGGTASADAPLAEVTVDDAAAFTASFEDGALGVFEATRMALGRRNANRIEVNGEHGSIAFDFERMNELEYYDGAAADDEAEGFRRIQVTDPAHPYAPNWWPTGHGLGYEHLFTHQAVDVVTAVAQGTSASPTFAEALGVQKVLAAVASSAADASRWTEIDEETR